MFSWRRLNTFLFFWISKFETHRVVQIPCHRGHEEFDTTREMQQCLHHLVIVTQKEKLKRLTIRAAAVRARWAAARWAAARFPKSPVTETRKSQVWRVTQKPSRIFDSFLDRTNLLYLIHEFLRASERCSMKERALWLKTEGRGTVVCLLAAIYIFGFIVVIYPCHKKTLEYNGWLVVLN